mmetsp:Transcript_92703/g.267697  ORF Transcript_92703/g.267697 Transcript_92703/m.267697 type:complete len:286 (-) Transcript_92703:43-900(-)
MARMLRQHAQRRTTAPLHPEHRRRARRCGHRLPRLYVARTAEASRRREGLGLGRRLEEVIERGVEQPDIFGRFHLGETLQFAVNVVDGATISDQVASPLADQHRHHERYDIGEPPGELKEHHGQRKRQPGNARKHRACSDHGVDARLQGASGPDHAGELKDAAEGTAEATADEERGDEEPRGGQGTDGDHGLRETEQRGAKEQRDEADELRDCVVGAAEAEGVPWRKGGGARHLGALQEKRLDAVVHENPRDQVRVVRQAREDGQYHHLEHSPVDPERPRHGCRL